MSIQLHRQSAFTLIEILIVVAIIGILGAILFPALSSAREKGRQSVCTSNLHQIAEAVIIYQDDCDGQWPSRFDQVADAGYLRSKAVCICPDDPTGNWGGLWYDATRTKTEPPQATDCSYLMSLGVLSGWEGRYLAGDPTFGIAACQVHGDRQPGAPGETVAEQSLGAYSGLILRVQVDGAVVRRYVYPAYDPTQGVMGYDTWKLFSDNPQPAVPGTR